MEAKIRDLLVLYGEHLSRIDENTLSFKSGDGKETMINIIEYPKVIFVSPPDELSNLSLDDLLVSLRNRGDGNLKDSGLNLKDSGLKTSPKLDPNQSITLKTVKFRLKKKDFSGENTANLGLGSNSTSSKKNDSESPYILFTDSEADKKLLNYLNFLDDFDDSKSNVPRYKVLRYDYGSDGANDDYDIILNLELNGILSHITKQAWELTTDILKIRLYVRGSVEKHVPKIEIYRKDKDEVFSSRFQLENIANNYLSSIWTLYFPQYVNKNPHLLLNSGIPLNGKTVRAETGLETYVSSDSQPEISYGPFYLLLKYLQHRLPTLNQYCIFCDREHKFKSLLKATVCHEPFCVFLFQEIHVGSSGASLSISREVIELLVSLLKRAQSSSRSDLILNPFPTVVEKKTGGGGEEIVLSPEKRNTDLLRHILSDFDIDHIHKNSLHNSLFSWIIFANPSYIINIPEDLKIPVLNTTHQYILIQQSPERDAVFNKLREKHGTTFAFHGSPIDNWHSILHNGLINASKTKLQLNGAAYGTGIYVSPDSSTSAGYSQNRHFRIDTKKGVKNTVIPDDFICIAITEIINKDIRKSGSIWVVPKEEYICTRFLLLYNSGGGIPQINTEKIAGLLKDTVIKCNL